MTWWVYVLKDPTTGEVRYVGKSSNPARRLHSHRSKSAAPRLRVWVLGLESAGHAAVLGLLSRHESESEALVAESNEIERLRASGAKLFNSVSGIDFRKSPRVNPFVGIGKRLKQARLAAGWSGAELAKRSGIYGPTISNIENGKRPNVAAYTAVLLARALGCSVEWLVTGESKELAA